MTYGIRKAPEQSRKWRMKENKGKIITSSIFLSQVGKPPDIAQPYRVPNGGKDEGQLAVPGLSLLFCKLRHPLIFQMFWLDFKNHLLSLCKNKKNMRIDWFILCTWRRWGFSLLTLTYQLLIWLKDIIFFLVFLLLLIFLFDVLLHASSGGNRIRLQVKVDEENNNKLHKKYLLLRLDWKPLWGVSWAQCPFHEWSGNWPRCSAWSAWSSSASRSRPHISRWTLTYFSSAEKWHVMVILHSV